MDSGPSLPPPPPSPSPSVRTALIVLAVVGAGFALTVTLVLASDPDVKGQTESPAEGRSPDALPEAGEAPTPADAPAVLAISWTEGDVRTYEILVAHDLEYGFDTGEAYEGLYRSDAMFELDPVDTRSNGSVDVEMSVPPVRLQAGVNDLPVGMGRPQPVRFRQDMAQDRLLELSADADGQSFDVGLLWPPLPSGPVRPGETWPIRRRLSNAQGSGDITYEGLCRFTGYEDLSGLETARIICRADATYSLVVDADLVAASAGLAVEDTARNGTFTVSGAAHLWLWVWIDPTRDLVIRADSQLDVDLKTRREGFETPWYTRATTVGTIRHRIQLVERPSSTVLT